MDMWMCTYICVYIYSHAHTHNKKLCENQTLAIKVDAALLTSRAV